MLPDRQGAIPLNSGREGGFVGELNPRFRPKDPPKSFSRVLFLKSFLIGIELLLRASTSLLLNPDRPHTAHRTKGGKRENNKVDEKQKKNKTIFHTNPPPPTKQEEERVLDPCGGSKCNCFLLLLLFVFPFCFVGKATAS
jgi:hypothetical protein